VLKPGLTISICSCERSELLRKVLQELFNDPQGDFFVDVILDGNNDFLSQDLCRSFEEYYPNRFRYFVREKKGLSEARNFALDVCRTQIIRLQDDDDILFANDVAKIRQFHLQNPRTALLTNTAILDVNLTDYADFVTGEGGQLFGYKFISKGVNGFDSFWGGRVSFPIDEVDFRFDTELTFGCEDIEFGFTFTEKIGPVYFDDKLVGVQIKPVTPQSMLARSIRQGFSQGYIAKKYPKSHPLHVWASKYAAVSAELTLDDLRSCTINLFRESIRLSKLEQKDLSDVFEKEFADSRKLIWGLSIDVAKSFGFRCFESKLSRMHLEHSIQRMEGVLVEFTGESV
jgi:hypothetical protein